MRLLVGMAAALVVVSGAVFAAGPSSPRVDTVSLVPYQGWSDDPDVIWYDSFDGPGNLIDRYLEYSSSFAPVTAVALGQTGTSLRAHFAAGQVDAGGLKMVFGRNPMDYRNKAVRPTEDFREIYWRCYVRHQPGWVGNPAKMSRAIAFARSDWSEAMIAHVWGGQGSVLCIDPARGVNSQSQVVTQGYNDFTHLSWLGLRNATYPIFDTPESGRWVCVEAHVRLNTPGLSDGVFTLIIDGQVQASRTDLNWVYSWQAYGINAVFLENYWNSGSPVAQDRWFDDFVISTQPIGLAKSPTNPTVWKTAFRDPDAGDVQSAWRLQVASDLTGADLLWDSGLIAGAGDSVVVDVTHGTFLGSLAGEVELLPESLYALRTRQCDAAGDWSAWSPWMTTLQTAGHVAGDANYDGLVDGADLAIWSRNYDPLGLSVDTFAMGDFNGDRRIDGGDLALWREGWGLAHGSTLTTEDLRAFLPGDFTTAAVPEPGTFPTLASGALGLATLSLASKRFRKTPTRPEDRRGNACPRTPTMG